MSTEIISVRKARTPQSIHQPIRVGIVGTGYIAEFHARAIQAIDKLQLVSVCDTNLASAQAFAKAWNVSSAFNSTEAMLRDGRLDAVHVLVPPDQHHLLAKTALQQGVHVFLEKPMCVSAGEADELLTLARDKGLHLGVNHNFLFSGAYQRLREVVASGALGPLDYINFDYFFELPPLRFGPFNSWMLRAPGNVILEIGPHVLSASLDLAGPPDDLSVSVDREISLPGGAHVFRRWRIHATAGRTAVDINVNLGPGFGTRTMFVRGLLGTAMVDFEANTCTVDRRTALSIDLDRYKRSRSLVRQITSQARQTFADYLFSRLKLRQRGNPYQVSIINSTASFYSSLFANKSLDIRIDGVFGRNVVSWCTKIIEAAAIKPTAAAVPHRRKAITTSPTILVLGGSGFIGQELIRQLLAAGHCVRAMSRSSGTALDAIDSDHLEIFRGDMRIKSELKASLKGIQFVYHLAHAEGKTWNNYLQNTVNPTHLVGEECLAAGVKRLIYTGTIASYYTGGRAGTITEQTPLDHNPRRDYYSRAKAAAEAILLDMHATKRLPVIIFRPGIVIGRGGSPFHWGVGRFTESNCEVWGDGNHMLPFVLVADVASALVRALEVSGIEGRSYNLVDIPLLTARDYLTELQRLAAIKLTIYYRPIWYFYVSDLAKWVVKVAVNHPDRVRIPSYHDWESRTQKAIFDCSRARADLGWEPASNCRRMIDEGIGGSLQSWLEACR